MTGRDDDFLEMVLGFLSEFNTAAEGQPATLTEIDADTDLIRDGVIDSLSIMELILFLEQETGAPVPLEDLMLDSVRTARTIAAVYGPHTSDAG